MGKLIAILFMLLLCGAMFWAGLTYAGGQPRAEKLTGAEVTNEQLARAKTVFEGKCARCHGLDGRGQTVLGNMVKAPDFTDSAWWQDDVSNRRLISSVTSGKKEMPAFGRKLTRQEINLLVAYVRRFEKTSSEK